MTENSQDFGVSSWSRLKPFGSELPPHQPIPSIFNLKEKNLWCLKTGRVAHSHSWLHS